MFLLILSLKCDTFGMFAELLMFSAEFHKKCNFPRNFIFLNGQNDFNIMKKIEGKKTFHCYFAMMNAFKNSPKFGKFCLQINFSHWNLYITFA